MYVNSRGCQDALEFITLNSHVLTKQQAATYLQVSQRSIDRYRQGKPRFMAVKFKGSVRFRPEDLDQYVKKQSEKG
jgi:hypothetical protein